MGNFFLCSGVALSKKVNCLVQAVHGWVRYCTFGVRWAPQGTEEWMAHMTKLLEAGGESGCLLSLGLGVQKGPCVYVCVCCRPGHTEVSGSISENIRTSWINPNPHGPTQTGKLGKDPLSRVHEAEKRNPSTYPTGHLSGAWYPLVNKLLKP